MVTLGVQLPTHGTQCTLTDLYQTLLFTGSPGIVPAVVQGLSYYFPFSQETCSEQRSETLLAKRLAS